MPGSTWEGSEAVLDASWTSLGRLLAALGRLLDPLGRFLAISWALSGATWLISGAFWVHCSLPRRSEARFWRVSGHAGLGFRRLGRHVLACRSLRLEFHDRMLFVKSAWPWPVSCQQDLPKCFLNWAVTRCGPHAFIAAVPTLLQLPALCLLPFWCGSLCAAHGIKF